MRVLLIDQEGLLCDRLGVALRERTHHKLRVVYQGADVVNGLGPFKPDVVIADARFITNWAEFLHPLRQGNPEVFIIPILDVGLSNDLADLSDLAVADPIRRPVQENEAKAVIEDLLHTFSLHDELYTIKERLQKQNPIIGNSAAINKIIQSIPDMAASDAMVLISGESGTGKELVARALHYLGPRAGQPFVPLNCGVLPEHLIENELFGHAAGAFTDARASQPGLVAQAEQGTLFLDEIESISLKTQVTLLRFLQERQYKRLGDPKVVAANVRVIAATNRDLPALIKEHQFREDLFYRLNVLSLHIPPLRERREDIPPLVYYFLKKYGEAYKKDVLLDRPIMKELVLPDWPGNVRELENKIQRMVIMSKSPATSTKASPRGMVGVGAIKPFKAAKQAAIAAFEREYTENVLILCQGNITHAAQVAQQDPRALRRLLRKYNIQAHDLKP